GEGALELGCICVLANAKRPNFHNSNVVYGPTDPPGSGPAAGRGGGEAETRRASLLIDRLLPPRPIRLAQLVLLQLAGGGAVEGVAELDAGRRLEVGQPVPAVRDEIGLG